MNDLLIETRTSFPSDKITINMADITKAKFINWFNFLVNLNGRHGVDIILEDSKRNDTLYKIYDIGSELYMSIFVLYTCRFVDIR